jgi:hypothetical protein
VLGGVAVAVFAIGGCGAGTGATVPGFGVALAGAAPACAAFAGAVLAGAPVAGAVAELMGTADGIAGAPAGSAAASCRHERTATSADALRRVAREYIDGNEGSLAARRQVLDAPPKPRLPGEARVTLIDVAPGAESLPLAASLAELVRRNIGRDAAKRAEFDRLRGAVAVVADDHLTSLTLRFDFGHLVVHTGVVGVPDITLLGPIAALEALGALKARGLLGLAWGELREGGAVRGWGDLKIYGLWTHPVLVRRLLQVLSER